MQDGVSGGQIEFISWEIRFQVPYIFALSRRQRTSVNVIYRHSSAIVCNLRRGEAFESVYGVSKTNNCGRIRGKDEVTVASNHLLAADFSRPLITFYSRPPADAACGHFKAPTFHFYYYTQPESGSLEVVVHTFLFWALVYSDGVFFPSGNQ